MTFWEAFKNSTILQAVITLLVLSAVVYLAVTNQPVPQLLESTAGLIIGFYFGAKVQQSTFNRAQEIKKE